MRELEARTQEERGGWKNVVGSYGLDAFFDKGRQLARQTKVARGQLTLALADGVLTSAEAAVLDKRISAASDLLGQYRALKHTSGKVVGTLAGVLATVPFGGGPIAMWAMGVKAAVANVLGNFFVRGNEYKVKDLVLDGLAGGGAGALGGGALKLHLGAKMAARLPDNHFVQGAARVAGDSVAMATGWNAPMATFQESTWQSGPWSGAEQVGRATAKAAAIGFVAGAGIGAVTGRISATKGGALGLAREIGAEGAPVGGLASRSAGAEGSSTASAPGSAPVSGGPGTVAPSGGPGTAVPSGGPGTAVPSGGSGTAVPSGGPGTAVPSGGPGTAVPSGGPGTAVPSGGPGTAVPSGGPGTALPSGGTGTAVPSGGPGTGVPGAAPGTPGSSSLPTQMGDQTASTAAMQSAAHRSTAPGTTTATGTEQNGPDDEVEQVGARSGQHGYPFGSHGLAEHERRIASEQRRAVAERLAIKR